MSDLELGGQLLQELHEALLHALPTEDELSQFTLFRLNTSLDAVAGSRQPLATLALNLLIWAKAQGRMQELVTALEQYRPDNPKVLEFSQACASSSAQTAAPVARVDATPLDAFITFNAEDRALAGAVAGVLAGSAASMWLDDSMPASDDDWQKHHQALLASRLAIVVHGKATTPRWQQPAVNAGLQDFDNKGGRILPVFLTGTTVPPDHMPPYLARLSIEYVAGPEDETALTRVVWAVTQRKPPQAATQPVAVAAAPPLPPAADDDQLLEIAELVKTADVTMFIGSGVLCGSPGPQPTPCRIATELLSELQFLTVPYAHLLPPVDLAGTYYSVQRNRTLLRNRVLDVIRANSQDVPPIARQLADALLSVGRPKGRRVRFEKPRIIVTTNVDTLLEKAFLSAGLPFTRVVQHTAEEQIDINDYRGIELSQDQNGRPVLRCGDGSSDPAVVALEDASGLDALVERWNRINVRAGGRKSARNVDDAGRSDPFPRLVQRSSTLTVDSLTELSLKEYTQPILYKVRGSHDIPDSCAFSSEQYFAYALRTLADTVVPSEITETLSNTYSLLVGYDFLDADFRLIYYTLLRKYAENAPKKWALLVPAAESDTDNYRQAYWRLRNRLGSLATSMGIEIVKEPAGSFFDLLLRQFNEDSGQTPARAAV